MTDETAGQWHHHLLTESVSTALSADIWLRAAPRPQDRCVDLGAGVGMLALPLSGEVAEVVASLRGVPAEAFHRTGNHTERGIVSLLDLVKLLAAHPEDHARQIRRVRDAFKAARSAQAT